MALMKIRKDALENLAGDKIGSVSQIYWQLKSAGILTMVMSKL
jgi:hypothetical protein